MEKIFQYFDPTYWGISPAEYKYWWFYLLEHVFFGFIPKVLASSLLALSLFSLVTRRFKPGFAIFLFLLSVFLAYFGTLLRWII